MKSLNEILTKNPVEDASQKITNLNAFPKANSGLKLPSSCYGPFCMRILKEFIAHNKLPESLPVPNTGDKTHDALSKIFDIILHSMGKEKRDQILSSLDEYNMSVPAAFRE